jgi:RNA polymerase sigma factor (sigma-70 family)
MGPAHDDGAAPEGRRDADLAVAAASGDSDALAAIYDRYAARVFALAVRQLRDQDAAADVTQEVFLTAAQRLGGLTDPERLRPWIFAVARHRIVDHVRRSRRVVPTDTLGDAEDTGMSSDGGEGFDRVRGAELRVLLADSSAGLDDRDRMVLELAYGTELAGADLADALGVRENTAHQLLSRARQRLRTSLGALLVARHGRRDCADLATLLEPWDGTFSTVWRKRVARHVDGCDACSDTERRVLSPAALGSAFPVLAIPEEVRAQVLAGLDHACAPTAAATRSAAAPRDTARRSDTTWRDDGFPPDESEDPAESAGGPATVGGDPRHRRAAGVLLAVAGFVLLGVLGAWWAASALARNDRPSDEAAIAAAPSAPGTAVPLAAATPGTARSPSTASPTTAPGTDPLPSSTRPSASDDPAVPPDDPPPPDPTPVLVVDPAGPLRLSRSGLVELTVSHTGDIPAAVTVSVPDGFAADPALLDVGAGGSVDVTVRWTGSANDPPPPATVSVEAPGFRGTTVEVLPFRDPVPATPTPITTTTGAGGTLLQPPPAILPPGPD